MQLALTGNASPLNVIAQMFVLIFIKYIRKHSEKFSCLSPQQERKRTGFNILSLFSIKKGLELFTFLKQKENRKWPRRSVHFC